MSSHELVERVAELRRGGRTPKEIARVLGLRPAEVALLIRAIGATTPKREAPLAGCWVTDRWADRLTVAGHPEWPGMPVTASDGGPSGLAGVLVARDTGAVATVCGYLVDAWCLGVKDTFGPTSVQRRKLPECVSRFFGTWRSQPPVPAPLELARHLVFGAVDYARGLGFEPHADFAEGAALLGAWTEGSSDVTFGMDGKPMYISGPHDDVHAIMATLRAAVGDGNFGFLVQPGPVSLTRPWQPHAGRCIVPVMQDPPGLDLGRLAGWLPTAVPEAAGSLSATLLAGGKSNLTYEVSDGKRSWVLRRPPLGHVLATAHDMAREYRVMAALQDTGVPVPRTYALCTDSAVIGAPFYLMQEVEGTAYRWASQLAPLGPERARAISSGLIDTLAALHAVDPAEVGLSDFGRPAGFLARQVSRWKKQLDASYCRDLPAAAELYAALAASVPEQSRDGIVHGDYRLDNVLVDDADRLAAVIDWEMATLGDPLTDLALFLIYQRFAPLMNGSIADASMAPGFLTEDEVLDRYAAASNRDLGGIGFYLGLAAYKLAVIAEGIYYRHLHGQTVGEGFAAVNSITEPLLEAGIGFVKGS